jgi:hypothetical protein
MGRRFVRPRLPIPVFRNPFFGPTKPVPVRILEDFFFPHFFGGISSHERDFGGFLMEGS